MIKKNNSGKPVKRIIKFVCILQVLLICFIYLFTKSGIYSIIFFCGAVVSLSGYLLMIKLIDRILTKRKGQGLFFLAAFFKMAVISAIFYGVSRVSEKAVLFYILGLSMIVLAIFMEGFVQLCRRDSGGRA